MRNNKKHLTPEFKEELETLLNCHSIDSETETPDFILAQFLIDTIDAYSKVRDQTDRWKGREAPICAAPQDVEAT